MQKIRRLRSTSFTEQITYVIERRWALITYLYRVFNEVITFFVRQDIVQFFSCVVGDFCRSYTWSLLRLTWEALFFFCYLIFHRFIATPVFSVITICSTSPSARTIIVMSYPWILLLRSAQQREKHKYDTNHIGTGCGTTSHQWL